MEMDETDQTRIKRIAQTLSEVSNLNETDMFILLTLMKNSKITNSELAKILDFKDGNSAAYHSNCLRSRKNM
jgi:predicted transcriptional regulator